MANVAVGTIEADTGQTAPYTQKITTGWLPRLIEFTGLIHQAALGSEYHSPANSGADNAYGWSSGRAIGSASADQAVSALGSNSASTDAHVSFVGEGEIIYLPFTSNAGGTIDGYVRARISSFDSDGFTLEWLDNYSVDGKAIWRAVEDTT